MRWHRSEQWQTEQRRAAKGRRASGDFGTEPPEDGGRHLGRRRPAARRLQAARVRPGHPAVHRAAPARRGDGADPGGGAGPRRGADHPEQGDACWRRRRSCRSTTPPSRTSPRSPSDARSVAKNLRDYINGFSANVREILDRFDFDNQITRLAEAKLLYQVVGRFADMRDLDKLSNHDMGYVFEHLIRKFAEDSNETAGEHFTPREVIELMVNLLIAPDDDTITGAGPGHQHPRPGLRDRRHAHHRRRPHQVHQPERRGLPVRPGAQRRVVGGLRVGDAAARPARHASSFGNSFSDDGYGGRKFDYMLANPPFGVEWKKVKDEVEAEAELGLRGPVRRGAAADQRRVVPVPAAHDLQDEAGRRTRAAGWRSSSTARRCSPGRPGPASRRSGGGSWRTTGWRASSRCPTSSSTTPGSPRTSGSCPTGRHRRCRARSSCSTPATSGRRCASPSATSASRSATTRSSTSPSCTWTPLAVAADAGAPGPREGEDLRHPGLRLPPDHRRAAAQAPVRDHRGHPRGPGVVQGRWPSGTGATRFIAALRESLGTVWWTKKDASAGMLDAARSGGALWPPRHAVLRRRSGRRSRSPTPKARSSRPRTARPCPTRTCATTRTCRWTRTSTPTSPARSLPHVPDAWIDHDKTKVGYEIPFTRHFYVYTPPRPLAEIDAELRDLEAQIQKLLGEVTG